MALVDGVWFDGFAGLGWIDWIRTHLDPIPYVCPLSLYVMCSGVIMAYYHRINNQSNVCVNNDNNIVFIEVVMMMMMIICCIFFFFFFFFL
jgi:membrane protein insertase Oxa1/YidC/SpoIIIJ